MDIDDLPEAQREATKARVAEMAAQTPCPSCGHQGMELTWRLKARPLGSFSLAGAQMKFSASEVPHVRCPGCGIEGDGRRSC